MIRRRFVFSRRRLDGWVGYLTVFRGFGGVRGQPSNPRWARAYLKKFSWRQRVRISAPTRAAAMPFGSRLVRIGRWCPGVADDDPSPRTESPTLTVSSAIEKRTRWPSQRTSRRANRSSSRCTSPRWYVMKSSPCSTSQVNDWPS